MKGQWLVIIIITIRREDKAGWVHQIGWDCRKGLAPALPRITNINLLKTGKQTCLHAPLDFHLLFTLFLSILYVIPQPCALLCFNISLLLLLLLIKYIFGIFMFLQSLHHSLAIFYWICFTLIPTIIKI